MSVLCFDGISKVFRSGLTGRRLYTLGPVSFEVRGGEIFGYLGPNGAGKTTTMKLALGLLRPTAGTVTCFGRPSTSIEVRKRIGFLPEQPYFYQHLDATELLEFYGKACGLRGHLVRQRADRLLELTGLSEFRKTRLSKFSKGMLQRMGLAQALINDPDIVILDEPLGGLDPVGRREIRDLILSLRAEGKTVFFSSHILQDVEIICDRVAILLHGRVLKVADVADVLLGSIRCVEIFLTGFTPEKVSELGLGPVSKRGDNTVVSVGPDRDVSRVIGDLTASGAAITAVVPQRQTLEDYFMNQVRSFDHPPAPEERQVVEVLQKMSQV